MTVDIRVGAPDLTINRGSRFMVTDLNGEIEQTKPQGLFAEDTRFISTYQLYVNQQPWQQVTSAAVTYYAARLDLTNPEVLTPDGRGTIPARTLSLLLDRQINNGLNEHFTITNFSQVPAHFAFELVMRSDFADLFEVKAGRLTRRGDLSTTWNQRRGELTTDYRNGDFFRRVIYVVRDVSSVVRYANGRLAFDIELKPGTSWQAQCEAILEHEARKRSAARSGKVRRASPNQQNWSAAAFERHQRQWVGDCTALSASNDNISDAFVQSIEDMGALRLPEHDVGPTVWVPAAGVPWFVALFGRDSLIVSMQSMMAHAAFAEGALCELAHYQATERDDWRDAQPGKILHELRHGELAHFHEIPHTPYYGTADATILYLLVLHEYYKWTGNRDLLVDLCGVADKCLEWIDKYGDLDGDGFQEYKTFSDQGYNNMGWKDAGDAIVYADGSQVKQPKALCELQGYVYDAKLRMAELHEVLGEAGRAKTLRQQAADLQCQFDAQFWMEDEGCYALGLDPDKRQIGAVASNMGHCLWSGIVPDERAERVVKRLLKADMWSGWGIRTLSTANPAYDPYSYQRGSVWPHDNSIIAAGMKRYGFDEEANKVAEGIFAASSFFDNHRLPEVFAGRERTAVSFPSRYLGANSPQAWATGSIFHLLQTILGLRADAPNNVLYVNPSLPAWLPDVQLRRVKVGPDSIDLRFWRDGRRSRFEVTKQKGDHVRVELEVSQRSVPSVAPSPGENRAAD